jgi:gas vesicle protein
MNNTIRTLAATIVGAGAGFIAGLLTAPRSGKETRKKLSEEIDSKKEILEETANEKLDEAREILNKTVDEQAKRGKKTIEKMKDALKS